ncbi:MAG: hypothetical protein PHR25_01365 [Clostridia bacterium]|nr:hypothetical protein [Clostridia bacterium]MDD4375416.1 hypothetical protein [Clostridia bacterium]
MSKNIRILYLYIISFIALCMIVGGFIGTVNGIASYYHPSVYHYYTEYNNASDSTYKENYEIRKRNAKRDSIKESITTASIVVIGAPLFMYHWSKIQEERKEGEV